MPEALLGCVLRVPPPRVLASIIIALVCIAAVQPRAYAGEAVQRNYSDYLDRVEVPSEGSATFEGSTFGLTGFERLAKGTARSVDGAPEGYRIPLSDQASVVVIRTPEMTLVHIDEGVAQQLGLYPFVSENDSVLWSMICALDEEASMGRCSAFQHGRSVHVGLRRRVHDRGLPVPLQCPRC